MITEFTDKISKFGISINNANYFLLFSLVLVLVNFFWFGKYIEERNFNVFILVTNLNW